MAVQKKKHRVRTPTNPNVFIWTGPRKKAALLISEGTKNYDDIAFDVGVHRETFWEWRQHPIFQAEVDRLTLNNELATKAGLLRLAYKAVDKKIGIDGVKLETDKTTVLDWAEFIVKLIPEDAKDDEDKLNALAEAIKQSARTIGK